MHCILVRLDVLHRGCLLQGLMVCNFGAIVALFNCFSMDASYLVCHVERMIDGLGQADLQCDCQRVVITNNVSLRCARASVLVSGHEVASNDLRMLSADIFLRSVRLWCSSRCILALRLHVHVHVHPWGLRILHVEKRRGLRLIETHICRKDCITPPTL